MDYQQIKDFFPLIAPITTLFGVWLGARLTRKNMFDNTVRQEFIRAANEFKFVFIEDFDVLDEPVNDKDIDLKNKFYYWLGQRIDRHEQAAGRFQMHLPEKTRIEFIKAWKQYKYAGYEEHQAKKISGYNSSKTAEICWTQVSNLESERRKLATKYLTEVLHFADHEKIFK